VTKRVLVVAAGALLAGCAQVTTLSLPTPKASSATTAVATTTAPNLTAVSLAGVAGRVRPLVAITPGPATLNGTIVGPAGPVGGADVHIERLVGDDVGATDVIALPDGTWSLVGVLGGRYRVRAWRSPDLDLIAPEIFFLNGTDTKSLTLTLQPYTGNNALAAIAPNPPIIDQPATLAVQITSQTVDGRGSVRAQPVANASVQLSGSSSWAISNPNPSVTGADGMAIWQVVCSQLGPQPLTALVNNTDTYPLTIAPCSPPPPPPTTTTAPGSTTSIPRTPPST
jgi:uncharacterized protein YceK